jgi:hypothetical protein
MAITAHSLRSAAARRRRGEAGYAAKRPPKSHEQPPDIKLVRAVGRTARDTAKGAFGAIFRPSRGLGGEKEREGMNAALSARFAAQRRKKERKRGGTR